jgi:hypothetical protein
MVMMPFMGYLAVDFQWYDWNMWAALGQMIGAAATWWTARIALKQIYESKRREEEALKPEVRIRIRTTRGGYKDRKIRIYFTNVKPVPIYVYEYQLLFLHMERPFRVSRSISSEEIYSEVPEMIEFGEASVTEIPVSFLIEEILKEKQSAGLFEFRYLRTTGRKFFVTIYLELEPVKEQNLTYHWALYYVPASIQSLDEMKTDAYFCSSSVNR